MVVERWKRSRPLQTKVRSAVVGNTQVVGERDFRTAKCDRGFRMPTYKEDFVTSVIISLILLSFISIMSFVFGWYYLLLLLMLHLLCLRGQLQVRQVTQK